MKTAIGILCLLLLSGCSRIQRPHFNADVTMDTLRAFGKITGSRKCDTTPTAPPPQMQFTAPKNTHSNFTIFAPDGEIYQGHMNSY